MAIHPTFNFVPLFRLKSRHASPNHHWPTTVLHSLMDMLRSNAFSISNPTSWPTIWIKLVYFCLVTENYVFPIVNGSILVPSSKPQACENMFMTRKWLPLLHLCTQSNFSQSTPHNDVRQQFTCFKSKLFCCHKCNSKSAFSSKSDTTPLLLVWKKLWTPSSLSISFPTSFLKCAIENWLMTTKATTLQVETPLLSLVFLICSWDKEGIRLQTILQVAPNVLWTKATQCTRNLTMFSTTQCTHKCRCWKSGGEQRRVL